MHFKWSNFCWLKKMDKGDIKTDRALSFGEKNTVQSVQYKDELFFKINL